MKEWVAKNANHIVGLRIRREEKKAAIKNF
jgi:hypothetical protein